MYTLDAGTAYQVEPVGKAVKVVEHNPTYSGLNYQLGALHTR